MVNEMLTSARELLNKLNKLSEEKIYQDQKRIRFRETKILKDIRNEILDTKGTSDEEG